MNNLRSIIFVACLTTNLSVGLTGAGHVAESTNIPGNFCLGGGKDKSSDNGEVGKLHFRRL